MRTSGLTRARRRAKIYFSANRRMHGLWTSNIPSRFLDELPEAHVAVLEAKGGFGNMGGGYGNAGASRFDEMTHFGSGYTTPGWQRAQAQPRQVGALQPLRRTATATTASSEEAQPRLRRGRRRLTSPREHGRATRPLPLAGERPGGGPAQGGAAFARDRRRGPLTIEGELVAKSTGTVSDFTIGDRVFHQKFGNGNVTAIDGNKLTIAFDKAGEKRVVDSFVERV